MSYDVYSKSNEELQAEGYYESNPDIGHVSAYFAGAAPSLHVRGVQFHNIAQSALEVAEIMAMHCTEAEIDGHAVKAAFIPTEMTTTGNVYEHAKVLPWVLKKLRKAGCVALYSVIFTRNGTYSMSGKFFVTGKASIYATGYRPGPAIASGHVGRYDLYYETVLERIRGIVSRSDLRPATDEDVLKAHRLHMEGKCPHNVVFDVEGYPYNFRSCHTCGEPLGAV